MASKQPPMEVSGLEHLRQMQAEWNAALKDVPEGQQGELRFRVDFVDRIIRNSSRGRGARKMYNADADNLRSDIEQCIALAAEHLPSCRDAFIWSAVNIVVLKIAQWEGQYEAARAHRHVSRG